MVINDILAGELQVSVNKINAAVRLIDEGNTIPFIARYRKDATGGLNDVQLRTLHERLLYLRNLEEKKEQVMQSIREQGQLTAQLEQRIIQAQTMVAVEDLYRPFRPKRRTRAMVAREKGLAGLADAIAGQQLDVCVQQAAQAYVSPDKGVNTVPEAIAGAQDIIAEQVADEATYRAHIREITLREGELVVQAKEEQAKTVYETYYQFHCALTKVAGYQILAINRGEKEKILTVRIAAPQEKILRYLQTRVLSKRNRFTDEVLMEAVADAYRRLLEPAVYRELRKELTQRAQDGAIRVFARNLQQLLMQPPIAGRVVLGWDPAFRTGCKLAVVDPTGKVLDTVVVYPTAPQFKVEQTKRIVHRLIQKYQVSVISLGNGTASRESEKFLVELLREIPESVQYVIVNEAGASVYSASELATEEFPQFDVGQRSAASIARRLQDPLAELVKIDPKAIGVGQYQHDMDQKKLSETLNGVVEDCVNRVGVDLNTASVSLLEHISGITRPIARNIVAYREEHGRFTERKQLLKVAKLGPKAYEQCAGFLRIHGGVTILDTTSVHPESYEVALKLLAQAGCSGEELKKGGIRGLSQKLGDMGKLSQKFAIGELTLRDIIQELEKPARDPREQMPAPILRTDVLEIQDLKEGMILKGTVRNVIDFGAFVDIGVHQDGLVHISQMTDKKYIKHPLEVVSVGDIVDVCVLHVDAERNRIQLKLIE